MRSTEHAPLLVTPASGFIRCVDLLLSPLMRLVAGPRALFERPQQTHFWNVQNLIEIPEYLRPYGLVTPPHDLAKKRFLGVIPWFHLPIVGGWRHYVVLEPDLSVGEWYIGWKTADSCAFSKIPLQTPVRMLLGNSETIFFGVTKLGEPTRLRVKGEGVVGEGGPFCHLPLL